MQCKAPVCRQVLQHSYMQGDKLGGSLARELVCPPCTALSLGRTVRGLQGDWRRTFLGCLLVNLHLHKTAILLKFLGFLFPQTRCFSSAPHMQQCLLTPGRPMPGSCVGVVVVFVCTCPHARSCQRLVQRWFQEKPHGQKLTLLCWSREHWPKS